MCGISGWIDFRRDLTGQRAILEAMTAVQAHRGPDGDGVWWSEHGGVGHRRLAIIDLEGGTQPMCDLGPAGAAVLTYSGEIYNFVELRRQLVQLGHRFTTSSDTEVVLRAYREWGPRLVDHLRGMYAFALWDEGRRRLLLVRDRLGIKPLYWARVGDGIVFGSEPKALLAHPGIEPTIDTDGLRQLFALVRPAGTAVFSQMHELRPGHLLIASPDGTTEHRYWQLEARPHTDDLDTTIAATRELLAEVIDQQLVADVPRCLLLSGGLDSSTITALAQAASDQAGSGPIDSYSVDFGTTADEFRPDAMRRSLDEPYAIELARAIGCRHTTVSVDGRLLLDPTVRHRAMAARDLPALGEIDTSLLVLFEAISRHSTVALSGEGADELFGGYAWFHDEAIVSQDTFPWLAMARGLGRYSMFEPAGTGLDIAAYQADLYHQALASAPRLDDDSPDERRRREISYLHLTHFLPTPLDRKDRMSMASGLEVRVPYCDHELVEYVFNAPWAMKTFDGREKSLLRAAAGPLLPASIAARGKSPYPSTQSAAYHEGLRNEVNTLLAEGRAPVLELMRRPLVRALAGMPANGAHVVRMGLERVLGLNDWLVGYQVRIV